jgi:tRNA A58 N-methylase Trm61
VQRLRGALLRLLQFSQIQIDRSMVRMTNLLRPGDPALVLAGLGIASPWAVLDARCAR